MASTLRLSPSSEEEGGEGKAKKVIKLGKQEEAELVWISRKRKRRKKWKKKLPRGGPLSSPRQACSQQRAG